MILLSTESKLEAMGKEETGESMLYKLNTGSYVPAVGFGTVALAEPPEVVKDGIRKAIQVRTSSLDNINAFRRFQISLQFDSFGFHRCVP